MKRNLKHVVAAVGAAALCIFAVVPTDAFAKNFGPYNWSAVWTTGPKGVVAKNVKDTDSYVQVDCNDSTISAFQMEVYGGNDYYGTMIELTYGGKKTPSYTFSKGSSKKMVNYVKENNLRIAALYSAYSAQRGSASGIWYPDI